MMSAARPPGHACETYVELKARLREISDLGSLQGLAGWDELTMMPSGEGAAEARGRALATLAGVIHAKSTDAELGALLRDAKPTEAKDVANVKRATEAYEKSTKVPSAMAKKQAELGSRGYQVWAKARAEDDFTSFAPVLKEWVALVREKCALVSPEKATYDASMDDYERGLTSARLSEIFTVVRNGVVPLIEEVYAKKTPTILAGKNNPLLGEFDVEKQAKLSERVAVALGFDMTKGRLDVSVHPFTGGCGPNDVRMTTRYKANDLAESLTGCIHETGHSLYEQGRCAEYAGQPVSEAHGMGVHESQSHLWERMVGLSEPFMHFLLSELKTEFPKDFADVTPEVLYAAFNCVKNPSVIRVESDEVTYPLHVILRTELEMGLLDGSIEVDQLPELWNEKMKKYLGVSISNNREGVLQDVHWSSGAFGYFPTYLIGAILACNIFNAAKRSIDSLEDKISRGEFAELREWLRVNVHERGSECDSADELMMLVTGKPLDAHEFVDYLRAKYVKLYDL
jgi:carboxypeptidase Taq